mgnify:CR=1 FL=1
MILRRSSASRSGLVLAVALTLGLRIGVFTISLDIHSAAMVQGTTPDSFEKLVHPDMLDREWSEKKSHLNLIVEVTLEAYDFLVASNVKAVFSALKNQSSRGKGEIRAKFIMGTNFCNDMTLSRQSDNHRIVT